VRNIDLKRESEDEKNKIIDEAFEAELDTL
jgi:hypothetical protein